MAKLNPIKRKDLITRLKKFDFKGPFIGGKHQFMIKKNISLTQFIFNKSLKCPLLKKEGMNETGHELLPEYTPRSLLPISRGDRFEFYTIKGEA